MSLTPSTCAAAISAANDARLAGGGTGAFNLAFASAYRNYSIGGTLSGGGATSGTEVQSILRNFLASFSSSTTDAAFGQALANYWATCMLTPSGTTISVTNDASTKVAAFTAAITASYTTTESTPYYLNFIQNIENVAKTIVWTCVKPNPLPPTLETIS
jgi:hypothetical protein